MKEKKKLQKLQKRSESVASEKKPPAKPAKPEKATAKPASTAETKPPKSQKSAEKKPAVTKQPLPQREALPRYDLNGKGFDSREDLIRSLPDDYASERRTTVDSEVLGARLLPGTNHPIHPGRLYGLLVSIIGHRQSLYCSMDELHERYRVLPNEKAYTVKKAMQIIEQQFHRTCETEKALTELASQYWPEMRLPHGSMHHVLPPNLYAALDRVIEEQRAARMQKRKKLKKKRKA